MKKIPLYSRNKVMGYALIDDEDLPKITGKWQYHRGYAQQSNGVTTTMMHRLIYGAVKGQILDHINQNKLDNRKANLRLCTPSQNRMNIGPNIKNKLGFKGVSRRNNTTEKKYVAFIYKNYKQFYLGYYRTPEEAARAYDAAATNMFGKFAHLNFPQGG